VELVQADRVDAEAAGGLLGRALEILRVAVAGPGAVARAEVAALGRDEHVGCAGPYSRRARAMSSSLWPTSFASRWYASAVSMRVTPASSAAWIVAIERSAPGRPSIDMGMPPRPIADTVRLPMVRCCICMFLREVLAAPPSGAACSL
jgi:hypothetical protein